MLRPLAWVRACAASVFSERAHHGAKRQKVAMLDKLSMRLTPEYLRRLARLEAMRFALDLYADLVQHKLLLFDVALHRWTASEKSTSGHALQDPIGALFVTILAIDSMQLDADALTPGTYEQIDDMPELTFRVRRRIGALLVVAHRFLTNAPTARGAKSQRLLVERLLTPKETTRWANHMDVVVQRQVALEAEVAASWPLLRMCTSNCMAACEYELQRVQQLRGLKDHQIVVMRGAVFFFVLVAVMHPQGNALLHLDADASIVGEALATILFTCAGAVARNGARFRAPYSPAVNEVARKLLCCARAAHARHLRIGPFAPTPENAANPTTRMVSEATVELAYEIFSEP